jgi:hypothetical protein
MKLCSISLLFVPILVITAACGSRSDRDTPQQASVPESNSGVNPGPLADGAYRASISVLNEPRNLQAEEQMWIDVNVKNAGNDMWPSQGQGSKYRVELGNHWLDKKGSVLALDDGRTELPHDLKPGEEVKLRLKVSAPKTSGDYTLEFDMVHEDITWFGTRGSQTTKVNVSVSE